MLAAAVLGLLAFAGSVAALVWLALPGRSDDAGGRFESALSRAADNGTLSGPVRLRTLTDFSWDRVWVSPPYDERGVEKLVGRDAGDVPAGGEFESVLVFARDGRLAGWLRVDRDLAERLDADVRSCLYVDEPIGPQARIRVQRRHLTFVDAAGRPRTDIAGSCPLVSAPPPEGETRRG